MAVVGGASAWPIAAIGMSNAERLAQYVSVAVLYPVLLLFLFYPLVCLIVFFDPRSSADEALRNTALQRFLVFGSPFGLPFLPLYLAAQGVLAIRRRMVRR
jgi:hypothetical protein